VLNLLNPIFKKKINHEKDIHHYFCLNPAGTGQMMPKFDELKIKYTYSEYPGGHTWPVWINNLYKIAPLLFR
jgi:hypothetical protein